MATALTSNENEIREGFLCPICMKDLGTIGQLQIHFENFHSNEDKAVFHSIKDLFGKAKKKILKLDTSSEDFLRQTDSDQYNDFLHLDSPFHEYQEMGKTTSHTDYFKHIRSSRVDRFVVETNKLLIRLDKLVTDAPLDPASRKTYEKSVVYWVDDSDVGRCPGCAKSFTLSRRRHHCRLCGGIMCANCSAFILFSYARKLTNPVFPHQSVSQPCSPMRRSGSSSSLNSLLNVAGEPHLRVCIQCKQLLDRRDRQIEERNNYPVIVHLYERLKSCMDDAEKLCPMYIKMADSLNSGKENYQLRDAQELRVKLIKLSESIDLLSKRIASLNRDNESISKRDLLLQRGIRNRASSFLQDQVIGLPSLPTEEELNKFKEKRLHEIKRKIAQEKLEAHQNFIRAEQTKRDEISPKREVASSSHLRRTVDTVSTEKGWGPDAKDVFIANDTDDPMLQQINNIKNYIRQAREAHLYDEVQILEANLRELLQEYKMQNK